MEVKRMIRFTKRHGLVLTGTALVALAFGVSLGVAKSGPGQTKAFFKFDSFPCPPFIVPDGTTAIGRAMMMRPGAAVLRSSDKNIGTANVSRVKGLLTANGQMRGALPGKYVMLLYKYDGSTLPATCTLIAKLDTFGVDGSKDGNFHGSTSNSTQQTFFLDARNTDLTPTDPGFDNASNLFFLGSS
jgi:hypothetical protein